MIYCLDREKIYIWESSKNHIDGLRFKVNNHVKAWTSLIFNQEMLFFACEDIHFHFNIDYE